MAVFPCRIFLSALRSALSFLFQKIFEKGNLKLKVITLLGQKGELASRDLKKLIKNEPRNKDTRLNHHYFLIQKRRVGSRSKTDCYWSLNKIGKWIYINLFLKNIYFFGLGQNIKQIINPKRYL